MHILLTIVALLIVLGIVVFVHELGHFLAARWAGVRVDTFSIGFGPAIVKWHDKRGTVWKIACLPLGGYVSIYGQEDMFNRKKYADLSPEKKKGHYLSAPAWKQFIIIAAGVFMNFVLAWVIYTSLFMFQPSLVGNSQLPVVGQVIQESPAFNAGIKPGDTIVRIDDEKISNWGELILAKELAANRDADVLIVREDKLVKVTLAPAERWGMVADGARRAAPAKQGLGRAMYSGARKTYYESKTLLIVLKQIVTGERSSKQLGSFITIAEYSGKAMLAGFFTLLSLIALLSVNLGVLNLLPLPVLDGGYLLILVIEAITRRKLQGRAMEIAIMIGWVLILGLFVLTMWNDLARVFGL
ncbi:MAG: site-2 protease family protein [Alphaproteobacteria bacterium]|nr:site-2 protease family protein [Alphaproteobacteria bacterium]